MKTSFVAVFLILLLCSATSKRFCGAEAPLRLSKHKTIAIMPVTVKRRYEHKSHSTDSSFLLSYPDFQSVYYQAVKALTYPIDSSRHTLLDPKTSNQVITSQFNKDSFNLQSKHIGKALNAQALMYTHIKEGRHDALNVVKFFANVFVFFSSNYWTLNDNLDRAPRFKVKIRSKFVDVKTGKTLCIVKSKRYCHGLREFNNEALKLIQQQAEKIPYNHFRVIGAGVL